MGFYPERGGIVVESAVSIMFAAAMILGGLDLVRLVYHSASMQYVLSRAARWGSLGQVMPNPANPAVNLSREESIRHQMNLMGDLVGLNFSDATITICPETHSNCSPNNAGGPNESFVIKVSKPTSILLNVSSVTLTAEAVGRNEPYA
ncbi:MAG: hypothetical protein DCC75_05090 [Proteobacteria bacterium]|nr:MAG: hypothetical protein DCC75_05090 [Pseudomonadota bacterium]